MARPRIKPAPAQGPGPLAPGLLTSRERFAAILAQFRAGASNVDQVVAALKEQLPATNWSREGVYLELRQGLVGGYLSLETDRDQDLEPRLKETFGLHEVAIVPSVHLEDVASRAARAVLKIIADLAEAGQKEVTVGFASGLTISVVARHLAQLIVQTGVPLPAQLHLIALSAGFNPKRIREDPNFFMAAFDTPAISLRTNVRFVGLYAESIVKTSRLAEVRSAEGIKEAIESAKSLDVIVTSASDLDDRNSTLSSFYKKHPEEMDRLKAAGVVGHMLYLPLAPSGPVPPSKYEYALPTVIDLPSIGRMISQGSARVVLVAGLQFEGFKTRAVISTILNQKQPLVTDLVLDQRNAKAVKLPAF